MNNLKSSNGGSPAKASAATLGRLATLDRMQAQQAALRQISASEAFTNGQVERLAQEITVLATSTVGVERANIWLFNPEETELRCIDLFEATPRRAGIPRALCSRRSRTRTSSPRSATSPT